MVNNINAVKVKNVKSDLSVSQMLQEQHDFPNLFNGFLK